MHSGQDRNSTQQRLNRIRMVIRTAREGPSRIT